MKPQPALGLAAWMRGQPSRSLFTASICCAEILAGIAVLPARRRRSEFEAVAGAISSQSFRGKILSFDEKAASAYAELLAMRRAKGRPIATADLIVAATARAHHATIVTRNIGDFEHCGIDLSDPWTSSPTG